MRNTSNEPPVIFTTAGVVITAERKVTPDIDDLIPHARMLGLLTDQFGLGRLVTWHGNGDCTIEITKGNGKYMLRIHSPVVVEIESIPNLVLR